MTITPPIAAALIGVTGVIIGVILRPIFEDWYQQRNKTVTVKLGQTVEFRPPHRSVNLEWEGETVKRLLQTGFTIRNSTGRTLRDFALEISASESSNDSHLYSAYLNETPNARWSEASPLNQNSNYEIEYFERKSEISGSFISTYTSVPLFRSPDDIEIYVKLYKESSGYLRTFYAAVLTAFLVSMTATALASLN